MIEASCGSMMPTVIIYNVFIIYWLLFVCYLFIIHYSFLYLCIISSLFSTYSGSMRDAPCGSMPDLMIYDVFIIEQL
jgi:hypothetical protein